MAATPPGGSQVIAEPLPRSAALACPRCLRAVDVSVEGVRCPACGTVGAAVPPALVRLDSGLPDGPPSGGGAGRTMPSPAALERSLSAAGPLDHAAWLYFVPPLAGRTVLCVEGGMGGASLAAAAHHARHVYCLQPDPELAEAIAAVAALRRLRTLTVVTPSEAGRLPFADGVFDVVALHAAEQSSPVVRRALRDRRGLLRELARVVRPDGVVHLDGHTRGWLRVPTPSTRPSLPMVRTMVGLWQLGVPPRRLLRRLEAGGRPYRATTLLNRRSLLRDLKPTAGVLLRGARLAVVAGWPRATLQDVILGQVLGADPDGKATLHFGSGHAFRMQTRDLVFRLPRGEGALRRCQNGFAALERLATLSLSFATPQPVTQGAVDGHAFLVESRVHGREIPYLHLSRSRLHGIAAQAARMITELHLRTRRRMTLDQTAFRALIGDPLEALASRLDAGDADHLRGTVGVLETEFRRDATDLVMTHGDFKITNLVEDGAGAVVGLVDWDLSEEAGLPAVDLILYRAFDRVLLHGEPFAQAILHIAGAEPDEDPLLRRYREEFRIDRRRWRTYGLLSLAHYFLKLVGVLQDDRAPAFRGAILAACRLIPD